MTKANSGLVFESWDFDSLTKFLKHHGIKVDEKANKSDLLKTLKSKFSSIAKKNKGSNFYPGDWLYESWSEDDLKNWLNNFKIEFDKGSSKSSLVEKVKEYNYKATNDIIDTKDALFDSLDLFDKSIFDKGGQIRDEFLNLGLIHNYVNGYICMVSSTLNPMYGLAI